MKWKTASVIWILTLSLIMTSLHIWHSISFAKPNASTIVSFFKPVKELNAIHFISENCSCSTHLINHLVERGNSNEVHEKVIVLGNLREEEKKLKTAGYKVERIKVNVNDGPESTTAVIENFNLLKNKLQSIHKSMQGIISANEEKMKGIDEVSKAMDQLSTVAQTNQNEADTLSSYSGQVTEMSKSLSSLIIEVRKKLNNEKVAKSSTPSTNISQPVNQVSEEEIDPAEGVKSQVYKNYVNGIYKKGDEIITFLDIKGLLYKDHVSAA